MEIMTCDAGGSFVTAEVESREVAQYTKDAASSSL